MMWIHSFVDVVEVSVVRTCCKNQCLMLWMLSSGRHYLIDAKQDLLALIQSYTRGQSEWPIWGLEGVGCLQPDYSTSRATEDS